jgi:hypothetical protein
MFAHTTNPVVDCVFGQTETDADALALALGTMFEGRCYKTVELERARSARRHVQIMAHKAELLGMRVVEQEKRNVTDAELAERKMSEEAKEAAEQARAEDMARLYNEHEDYVADYYANHGEYPTVEENKTTKTREEILIAKAKHVVIMCGAQHGKKLTATWLRAFEKLENEILLMQKADGSADFNSDLFTTNDDRKMVKLFNDTLAALGTTRWSGPRAHDEQINIDISKPELRSLYARINGDRSMVRLYGYMGGRKGPILNNRMDFVRATKHILAAAGARIRFAAEDMPNKHTETTIDTYITWAMDEATRLAPEPATNIFREGDKRRRATANTTANA